jgi:hypothetical protein
MWQGEKIIGIAFLYIQGKEKMSVKVYFSLEYAVLGNGFVILHHPFIHMQSYC